MTFFIIFRHASGKIAHRNRRPLPVTLPGSDLAQEAPSDPTRLRWANVFADRTKIAPNRNIRINKSLIVGVFS